MLSSRNCGSHSRGWYSGVRSRGWIRGELDSGRGRLLVFSLALTTFSLTVARFQFPTCFLASSDSYSTFLPVRASKVDRAARTVSLPNSSTTP